MMETFKTFSHTTSATIPEGITILTPSIWQRQIFKAERWYTTNLSVQNWAFVGEPISEQTLLNFDINRANTYGLLSQSTEDLLQTETVLICLTLKGVKIPKPAEVRDYLFRHPDMTNLLLSVSQLAMKYLGAQVILYLERYHDPEIEDEYLTLYIRQENYDERILDTIEIISSEFEAELERISGWLLVTTDFAIPR